MKQVITNAIVLARTNYQEADRIITAITPDQGKLRLLAKGVRKSKSKMAGGIELFSIAEIGFIRGKGDLSTLTTSRLKHHFDDIAKDIDRTMLGYDLLKLLNKATEDETGKEYFDLLATVLEALDTKAIDAQLIELWFYGQLLRLAGRDPNTVSDISGQPLQAGETYIFSYDDMAFSQHPSGEFTANYIKVLRLILSKTTPQKLAQVSGLEELTKPCLQLLKTAYKHL